MDRGNKTFLFFSLFALSLAAFMPASLHGQYYSGSQMVFGKNRVQYNDFLWSFHKYDRFDTYFYLNGKELALFTARYAEEQIPRVEKKLETSLTDKIQFIIFNRLSEKKQSNLGLSTADPYNTGGLTRILDQKVILYFDGDHEHFKRQIREGITEVLLNQMLFGSSVTSQVTNSTLLFLPDWYTRGLLSYLTEEWNTDIDNRVRDGILSGRYRKFNRLSGKDAEYSGHSLWNYVAEKYGKDVVPNIVYMAKVSKNVESGFLYVLGISFKTIVQDWLVYYESRYRTLAGNDSLPPVADRLFRSRAGVVYDRLRISGDGKYAAFTTNEAGQYKVWLYDLEKKKKSRLLKRGYKLDEETDYSYPLIAWHPGGRLLAVITEEKGRNVLYFFSTGKKSPERRLLFQFDKVLDFSYSPDGRNFAMSAVIKGQSDILVYNIAANSYEHVSKDIFDDNYPRYINKGREIVFSSNRPNDSLFPKLQNVLSTSPGGRYDLFAASLRKHSTMLRRITSTPFANEVKAREYSDQHIAYLSDENGIFNRYMARFDSAISFIDTTTHYRYFTVSYPLTNYSRNILDQDISPGAGLAGEIIFSGNRHQLYLSPLQAVTLASPLKLGGTPYMNELMESTVRMESDSLHLKRKQYQTRKKRFVNVMTDELDQPDDSLQVMGNGKIDINNYIFEKQAFIRMGVRDTSSAGQKTAGPATAGVIPAAALPKQLNYLVEYSIQDLVSQVDFNYLNYSYQSFTGGTQPIWLNPGFSVLFKVGASDLMEDYRIVGGIRPSLSFINNEYLLSYADLRGRLDKEITFHRQVLEGDAQIPGPAIVRTFSHEVFYALRYPFDEVISARATTMFRHDRSAFLSTDEYALREPNQNKSWASLKGELVYDDTRNLGLNLYDGARAKIFAEYFQQLTPKNVDMFVLGIDVRKYMKVHRNFIWANRLAASTSFGSNKLIYYMGGVDNWLAPKFNKEVPVAQDNHYAYQTLATNMRGFTQNIRNGSSFAVLNSELRFPIFRYFANRPIKSDFLNNFQVIGFGDLGTAWNGPSPWSRENSLYTKVIKQGPITVTVENQVEPLVGGYGFGFRTRLLGYFVRADWAWGVEDLRVQAGQFYLSLSLDF